MRCVFCGKDDDSVYITRETPVCSKCGSKDWRDLVATIALRVDGIFARVENHLKEHSIDCDDVLE